MSGKLLIDAHYTEETRIAIIGENGKLENFEAEYVDKKPIKGNIYLAKIVRIEPAIQAAFIDYGGDKHGFIPLSEIHYDYFNKNIMKSLESEFSSDLEKENLESEKAEESSKSITKRQFKIQEVISTKQILLVQAEKEIRGNKCAFFTTFITLPGRYCVLMPNPPKGKTNGISRKIDFSEKERLRDIVNSLDVPEGMSCIVRTAGENRTKQEIKRDLEYLCRLWNEIRAKVTSSIAPTLIHEEGNIIKRSIRDLYQRTMDKIVIQGKDAYKEARAFMKSFTPSHVKKIELYDDKDMPIFHKYQIEDKIDKILDPTVTLPSGGSIVINTTEALTAIDVNSGKLKNERDIEGTALKTNLEAAIEIGRQIKLRDIAGIIVIDFIDMTDHKDNSKIEKKMREVMKDDYSSMHFSKLSQFGLMEISRQRLRTSLADSTFAQCSHCKGSGRILANETVALSIIRKIENFLVQGKAKRVVVELSPGIDLFILNRKRRLITEMETNYEVSLEITRNPGLSPMDCKFIITEYKAKLKDSDIKNNSKSKSEKSQKVLEIVEEQKITNKTNVKGSKTTKSKTVNKNTKNSNKGDKNSSILEPEPSKDKKIEEIKNSKQLSDKSINKNSKNATKSRKTLNKSSSVKKKNTRSSSNLKKSNQEEISNSLKTDTKKEKTNNEPEKSEPVKPSHSEKDSSEQKIVSKKKSGWLRKIFS